MKAITIYATAIKVPEKFTIASLLEIEGFEELLEKNISPRRKSELVKACREYGIDILFVVAPDGFTDEWLVSKIDLKIIIKAIKNTARSVYSIDSLGVRKSKLNESDKEFVLRVLSQASKLGVEQERLMDIFDEVLVYIGEK